MPVFLAPHPFSSTRAKRFESSVDEEHKILFELRNRSAWYPSSESMTNYGNIKDAAKAKEYGDSLSSMKLDSRRHVRTISEPRERFNRPASTGQLIGWHRGCLPERDSEHKVGSSEITQFYMNMIITKANMIIR
jgi:hypothetical protein